MKSQAKFLLAVAMFASAASSVAATFINVFLMRSTHNSIDLVVWQNIMNYLILLIAFVSGTFILGKLSITRIFQLGIFASILYYLIILLMRNHLQPFIIPLGIFSGLGNGLYWFSLNLLIGNLVDSDSRPKFFSYQQMMGFAFGIIVPAFSGWLIVKMPGLTGYYLLFAASIVLSLAAIALIFRLHGFKTERKMNVFGILRLRGNHFWNANIMLNISMGFKGALNTLVFVLFAYLLFSSEKTIGDLTSLQAALSVVSALTFAKLFNRKYTRAMYFLTACLSFLAFMLLAIFASPAMMILAFVIFGIIQSWGSAIANSMNYQFSDFGGSGYTQGEYIVASEFPMAIGRIGGLILVLILTQLTSSIELVYRLVFAAIGLMWLLEFFVIDRGVGWRSTEFEHLV